MLCHNRICRKQGSAHPTIAACEHTQSPCFSFTIWRVRSLAVLARWRLGTFVALTCGSIYSRYLPRHPSRTTDHCGAARTREGNERDMHCLRTLGPDKVRSPSQACKVPVDFVSDFLLYAVCAPCGMLYRHRSLSIATVVKTESSNTTHGIDEA